MGKKHIAMLALGLLAVLGVSKVAMAEYLCKTVTIPAGTLSANLTNDAYRASWTITDVYGYGSEGATTADVAYVTKLAGTTSVVVDSGTISSNSVAFRIDMDGVVPVQTDEYVTITRTALSTNQAVTAIIVIEQ